MPSMDEYAKAPVAVRLKRLERTPDELAGAVRGQSEAALARRPDPKLSFDPATPDRWAEERQYLRNDVAAALAAFRKRREDNHLDQLRRALEGRA
ncbi:MAG: hypothetical protein AUH77_10805 [Candidatus Rokubacteria bacterium 13_1_40CM_4_69_39]|nr:MAG: hypothetical protein AUH77_10805 [Candidatus Rokubacteria bacterium 13_1_40CM_4_69_39]